MRKQVLLGAVLAACPLVSFLFAGASPYSRPGGKATITFDVVDDGGVPVPSALVHGHFWNPHARDYAGDIFKVTTDEKGRVRVRGRAFDDMQGGALCEGYYKTEFRMVYPGRPTDLKTLPAWPDWVATNTVVLKRIRNPVPMYVKRAQIAVPIEHGSVGYDMLLGDWVGPLGRGLASDMTFKVNAEYQSFTNWRIELDVQVPGVSNGLTSFVTPLTPHSQPVCELRSTHEAPADSYVQLWHYKTSRTGNEVINPSATDLGRLFYFRIRSEVDEQGRLVRAMYGKVYGHIFADFDENRPDRPRNIVICFTYYLNPDGTRNVEFHPERNLFPTGKRDAKFAP